jgi:hypothetical protein
MKHEILEEVWRVREEISAECGHDVKKLATMLRREEAKYGKRLARLPICQQTKATNRRQPVRKPVATRG